VSFPAGAVPDGLDLIALAARLTAIDGVVGVALGGSRARGDHTADSDVDLGLYYQGDLDTAALGALARDVAGPDAEVTERGGWGPWVDGGGWLVMSGVHVDWIYRDIDRVREAWARAHRGAYDWNAQTGHPLGVPDFAYVGELALSVVLADPSGALTDLRDAMDYPDALRAALAENLWEADFLLQLAAKATSRRDAAYVALCLSRALLLCAHALHGHHWRWLVNEKGAVAGAGRLPSAPADFAERVAAVTGRIGTTASELDESVRAARLLIDEVTTICDDHEETPWPR
jgi:predicted nucleotidyltransferase